MSSRNLILRLNYSVLLIFDTVVYSEPSGQSIRRGEVHSVQ